MHNEKERERIRNKHISKLIEINSHLNRKGKREYCHMCYAYRIKYLTQMIRIRITNICSKNFVASISFESILNVTGTETPNGFSRHNSKQ